VHGLSADATGLLPLLQRLQRHARRVIALELPGHGGSEAPSDFTLAACVGGAVEAIASHLGGERAIIFGNSLGGLTAIRFALARPDLVRGLFVVSPAGAPSSPEELAELLVKFRIETTADALRFMDLIFHERRGPQWLSRVFARDLVRRHRGAHLRALLRDVPNARPFEPADLARLASIPTYFMWGRSERLLPPSHLAFWKKHLQHATIEEPYGFGHSAQLDSPKEVARRVLAFAHQTP
jgi:pimeloyl-ACP methyl ester carboxylesterase